MVPPLVPSKLVLGVVYRLQNRSQVSSHRSDSPFRVKSFVALLQEVNLDVVLPLDGISKLLTVHCRLTIADQLLETGTPSPPQGSRRTPRNL
jgi:hypothetical protein